MLPQKLYHLRYGQGQQGRPPLVGRGAGLKRLNDELAADLAPCGKRRPVDRCHGSFSRGQRAVHVQRKLCTHFGIDIELPVG